jgi:hypothetical protein
MGSSGSGSLIGGLNQEIKSLARRTYMVGPVQSVVCIRERGTKLGTAMDSVYMQTRYLIEGRSADLASSTGMRSSRDKVLR